MKTGVRFNMKKVFKISLQFIFLFFFNLNFAISAKLPDDVTFWSDYPHEALADALVEKMSDEELYAQILMFGWAGAEPSTLLNSWVDERGLGSVKVFGWNTDNIRLVARSIKSLQRKALARRFKIPLFVATDQEGGWIRHVKGSTSVTPGNLAIGASGFPYDAYYSGYYINREIAALGINMNFAPTVDLYTDKRSTIIGTRSFGEDPRSAGILGAAFAQGSLDAGVIPTAKHFPGHGDTPNDSHGYLPNIQIDKETFENRELVPFKYLIKTGVPAIMSGHLSFPRISPNGEPATLSEFFLTELLRNRLGFEGLIITDDMMMNGATIYAGSLSVAFRMAINAGNDIVISSTTAQLDEPLWSSNLRLMRTDEKFRAKVKAAARRVIYEKLKYFKGKNPAPLFPDENKIDERIPDKEGEKFFFEQACRSLTVYKRKSKGLKKSDFGRVLLCGSEPTFFSSGKERWPNSGEFHFSFSMGPNETQWSADNILQTANRYDTIIFCVADANSAQVAQTLRRLSQQGKRVIIFAIMSPVLVADFDWADTVLLGYSYSPYSLEALVGACAGEFEPQGIEPISNN
ncbi:MAG: glycoside hydrolase family 3 protein [Treponemataceae bacterium]|nr:glycoside hydrolase family 3 protein [Treponemataceae bacterium]